MNGLLVRSVTAGMPLDALTPSHWKDLAKLYETADAAFRARGIPVRTRRLVLESLTPRGGMTAAVLFSMLDSVARHMDSCGIRWVCLPISPGPSWFPDSIPLHAAELLRKHPFLFLHFPIATDGEIRPSCLRSAAEIILRVSRMSANGFDNFRVGAGANIVADTPFFPFSFHVGPPSFSLAAESLEPVLAVARALAESRADVGACREGLLREMVRICSAVDEIGREVERMMGGDFAYRGLDASLAPFPEPGRSVAELVELVGPSRWGELGTTGATAFLTRVIKAALKESGARAAGFNGVMYSPLEDTGLARRLNEEPLAPEHFMLYSTTCGCGVDMVPVEGDTLPEEIAALLQDVCALSSVHRKPLGVRILPIPHGHVNERTAFNHDFLVNTRILRLRGGGTLCDGRGSALSFKE